MKQKTNKDMNTPTSIYTNERIFQIQTFDGELILCNLRDIYLKDLEDIKSVKHYWNGNFAILSKRDLKDMLTIEMIG